MYKIDGTTISLVRGDSLATELTLKRKTTGETYTPVQGDVIRFAMKRNVLNVDMTAYVDKDPLIAKTIPIATMLLEIEPEDTKELPFGEYVYDIEITFANGDVDTFIHDARFKILPEVE